MARQYDEIGVWSELKLTIIRDHAVEYSKILSKQSGPARVLSHEAPPLAVL